MNNSEEHKLRWILFITMWGFFVVIGVLTIAMLFFGFGTVQESERVVLFNVFVGEILAAIPALYYSIFKLKKPNSIPADVLGNNSNYEAIIQAKNSEISSLKKQLSPNTNSSLRNNYKYRNSIIALCSVISDTEIDEIVEQHGLNTENLTQERVKLISEIGRLKEEGVLINRSVLNHTAVRLSN